MLYLFIIVATIPLYYFIESFSWIKKFEMKDQGVGVAVAKTNIMLYVSRSFIIVTSLLGSFYIESNFEIAKLLYGASFSIILMFVIHMMLERSNFKEKQPLNRKVVALTAASTLMFLLALVAPWVLVQYFWEFRMTINSSTQFLNSVGSVIVLLFVDPVLYRDLDAKGFVSGNLQSYIRGRVLGCALALPLVLLSAILSGA